jgi:hypothetical protein
MGFIPVTPNFGAWEYMLEHSTMSSGMQWDLIMFPSAATSAGLMMLTLRRIVAQTVRR